MKKRIALVLGLGLLLSAGGCGGAIGRPDRPYIGEDVTEVRITHVLGELEETWVAEGEEVAALREWVEGLNYEMVEGEFLPVPGSEVYRFAPTQEGYPGFSYTISGPEYHYLLAEGGWHKVTNPSTPPKGRDIILTAEDITPTGLTLRVSYTGEKGTAEAPSEFRLESWNGEKWVDTPVENQADSTDELYVAGSGESWEQTVGWANYYGELVPGKYRLVKRILLYQDADHYDIRDWYAEFEII